MPGSSKKPDVRETVRVLSDYSYKPDDSSETISLKIGHEYQLIKKVNDDWWYVQKQPSPPFYIPAKYVEVVPKGPSDVATGGKSLVIGGAVGGGGGKSPNVSTSGKSLEPTSPAVPPPTSPSVLSPTRIAPKPKPRVSKGNSEDEALKVLNAAIDDGEVQDAKRDDDEAVKSNPLSIVSEIVTEEKPVETQKEKTKVGESVKSPSVDPTIKSVHPTLPSKPVETQLQKEKTKVDESAKSPSVDSTVKPVHPTLPSLPSAAASSGLPTSTGLVTPSASSGLPTSPSLLTSSPAPVALAPLTSPTDEINYMNLNEYQQMVRDRVAQTTVARDNLINSEMTTDLTTVAGDNPAESETSDYRSGDSKGGSRESLDSDSQGKSCDTDSIDAKEELEKVEQVTTPVPIVEESAGKAKGDPPVLQSKPPAPKAQKGGSSEYVNIDDIRKSIHARQAAAAAADGKTAVVGAPAIEVPPGWTVDVEDGVSTFVNAAMGEKWTSAVDKDGRNYFYNVDSHATVWSLADALNAKGSKMYEDAPAEAEPNSSEAAAEFASLEPLPIKMVQKQGQLGKAKVEQGKKAKKPTWSQSYAVLLENFLFFYKDQKVSAGAKPKSVNSLGKSELTLDLVDAQISSSPDEKKNQILVLTLSKGDVYLLHNESEDVLQHWRESLENNIAVLVTTPAKDVKDISTLTPTKPVEMMSRMSSYIGVLGEERLRVADKLLHWLKRRPTKELLQAKGILKDAVYGSSLTELCEREKTKIPRFVHECIVAVEKRGLDVEGVYRVGGNMANVQKLRQVVDNNEFYDLNSSFWDVHVVTGALKLFFRELSEPLFTFALFEEFLDAYKAQGRQRQVKAIRDIVRKLPTIHKETMKELFKHLTDVIRHTTSNRMNTQALAIVFGPTLLWPEAKNKDMNLAASMVYQGQVVEFMIIEFKHIFS